MSDFTLGIVRLNSAGFSDRAALLKLRALVTITHRVAAPDSRMAEVLESRLKRSVLSPPEVEPPEPPEAPDAETLKRLRRRVVMRQGDRLLLATSPLLPTSRYALVFRAMARLGPESSLKLAIAAEGPDERLLRGLASALGIGGRIYFLPPDTPPAHLHALADGIADLESALCAPGDTLAAMRAARPVLAVADGSGARLLSNETDGLVVTAKVDAWTQALTRFASKPDDFSEMGKAAAAHAHTIPVSAPFMPWLLNQK